MTIKGKIIGVLNEVTGVSRAGKSWRKREYVLETEGSYPKKVCFALMNDNIAKCNLQIGLSYEVDIDIESREFEGKWYHSVTAWRAKQI